MGLGLRNFGRRALGYSEACVFRLSRYISARDNQGHNSEKRGNWFVGRDQYINALGSIQNLVASEANHALGHRLDILGTGLQHWGDRIPWNFDIKGGYCWPNHYYKRLKHHQLTGLGGSDVKVPWELSRFQHITPLVQGYLLSRDEQYAREVVDQISDWICENPFCYGVNWVCAMEVAIRACNWIQASWALRGTAVWDSGFDSAFTESLWQHGWYIENNLEDKGGVRTNHYLSDIVGLLFIGVMYPGFARAGHWRQFAVAELAQAMDYMVYRDGTSFENSTLYHRLVLELFAYSALLCKRNSISLPAWFLERLEKMFEVVSCCIRPDGHTPIVGDSDDGRLFIPGRCYNWDRTDLLYLSSLETALFGRKNRYWPTCENDRNIDIFHADLFNANDRQGI